MQKRPRAGVIAQVSALALTLAGCSTASSAHREYRGLDAFVKQRAQLELPEGGLVDPEATDARVRELLAQPLTASSAERIALLNNHALAAELAELGIARGQLAQAHVLPNPAFEVAMRVPEHDAHGPEWELGLGIDLTAAVLREARAELAQAQLEAARMRAASAVLELALRVRKAYYAVVAAHARTAHLQTAVAAFAAGYEAARALHVAGNVSDLDFVTEQASYEAAKLALSEAHGQVNDAREQLNVLLGLHGPDTAWTSEASLPDAEREPPAREVVESQALEASLALAQARADLNAAERAAGLTESEGAIPDLTLGVSGEYDGEQWAVGPALSGRLPLFDRKQGGVLSARAQVDQARARAAASAVELRSAVRAVHARVVASRERAEQYRVVLLPLRHKVLEQTLRQYNAMQLGVFQLLQARRDELDSARLYVDTLLEHWTARAELDQLVRGGTVAPRSSDGATPNHLPRASTGAH
jgi:outer membrane protein, heavy metal efflux system